MSDQIGHALQLTIFGESHGACVGAVLQGIQAGTPIDMQAIESAMQRRRAKGSISTARTEQDKVQFLSGVYQGKATGSAITLQIENTNQNSKDYEKTKDFLRAGHADYTAKVRYQGYADPRGGGHFSGRLTAPLVAVGAICESMLQAKGVQIATRLARCAGICDADYTQDQLPEVIKKIAQQDFPVYDENQAEKMKQAILQAAKEGDSVGGVLETMVCHLPAGIGSPFFDSVESTLSALMFSIPAVKGIEFGAGFALCGWKGSKANDTWQIQEKKFTTRTNHNGGVNGGITNGMPLIFRCAVKPTSSIYQEQPTVDLQKKQNTMFQIQGRHDPCIAHRAAQVQTALTSFALVDLLTMQFGEHWQEAKIWNTV